MRLQICESEEKTAKSFLAIVSEELANCRMQRASECVRGQQKNIEGKMKWTKMSENEQMRKAKVHTNTISYITHTHTETAKAG